MPDFRLPDDRVHRNGNGKNGGADQDGKSQKEKGRLSHSGSFLEKDKCYFKSFKRKSEEQRNFCKGKKVSKEDNVSVQYVY